MPKDSTVRLASLRTHIEAQERKLAEMKTVKSIQAKIIAARETIAKIEADEAEKKARVEAEAAKISATKKRKEDTAIRIITGAGVHLLDEPDRSNVLSMILCKLTSRDQARMNEYARKYGFALGDQTTLDSRRSTTPTLDQSESTNTDPTAAAIMRVLGQMDCMVLSMIEPELLKTAEGDDRRQLEEYFAALGKKSAADMPVIEIVKTKDENAGSSTI